MKKTPLVAALAGLLAFSILAADASAMYHPTLGTWLQRDPGPGGMMAPPRVGAGGPAASGGFAPRDYTSQYDGGANLLQYVRSSPVIQRDPFGLIEDLGGGVFYNSQTGHASYDAGHDPSTSAAERAENRLSAQNFNGRNEMIRSACRRSCPEICACSSCTEELCRSELENIFVKYETAVNQQMRSRNLGYFSTGLLGNLWGGLWGNTNEDGACLNCIGWQSYVYSATANNAGRAWQCWRVNFAGTNSGIGHNFVGLYHCCNNNKVSPDFVLDPWRNGTPSIYPSGTHGYPIEFVPNFVTTQ